MILGYSLGWVLKVDAFPVTRCQVLRIKVLGRIGMARVRRDDDGCHQPIDGKISSNGNSLLAESNQVGKLNESINETRMSFRHFTIAITVLV